MSSYLARPRQDSNLRTRLGRGMVVPMLASASCLARPRQDSNLRTRLGRGMVVPMLASASCLARPRQDSNLRTRLRRPMLYPLSYEGGRGGAYQRAFAGPPSGSGRVLEPRVERAVQRVQRGPGRRLDPTAAGRDAEDRAAVGLERAGHDGGVRGLVTGELLGPQEVGRELRREVVEPLEGRGHGAADAGARRRASDHAPPLVREVDLELVGVGKGEDGEEADPRAAGGDGLEIRGRSRV